MKNKFKTLLKKIRRLGFTIKDKPSINDPVCGLEVADDFIGLEYMGTKYYFCSDYCQLEFKSRPHKYLI